MFKYLIYYPSSPYQSYSFPIPSLSNFTYRSFSQFLKIQLNYYIPHHFYPSS